MAIELNPQQMAFKEAYLSPKSDSFGNAYASAKKAGYAEEYSQSITAQGTDWVSEIIRDRNRLGKAEKALDETLEMPILIEKAISEDLSVVKTDSGLVRAKNDVAKFVCERLGGDKYREKKETSISFNLSNILNNLESD